MLTLIVGATEQFDEGKEEFVKSGGIELQLEHSLVSLSKWESKFEKPFLSETPKSTEEALGYIVAMIVTPNVPPEILEMLTEDDVDAVNDYINSKMSATWFRETKPDKKSSEVITSELIYYWMNAFAIPKEHENWHLGRLFNLIRIHNLKNTKPEKVDKREAARQRSELNAQRRAQLGTNG